MKPIARISWLAALAALLAVYGGCGGRSQSASKTADDAAKVPVEVAQATVGDISNFFTGTATLEAANETEVVAKVRGVVKEILTEEGSYVPAGAVLAKLDDEQLAVQFEQAEANFKRLDTEYQRAQQLFKEKLISAQEFQKAEYEYQNQKAAYDLAKLDLEYTSIRTPIAGVVAERKIKVGNMVLPNQATFRVTDPDRLWALLHVPERQIGKLRVGHVANVAADAIKDAMFTGEIDRISPVVDPSTGTVKVTIGIHDVSRRLKPGMFARINIVHDVHANATLVPRDAILEEDNESAVFIVKDNVAYRQAVETGYVNTTHIEVIKGLAAGDLVVTAGKAGLKDSTKVEQVSAGGEPSAAGTSAVK
jgi:membrane fusion protein (multidrug efflux system)